MEPLYAVFEKGTLVYKGHDLTEAEKIAKEKESARLREYHPLGGNALFLRVEEYHYKSGSIWDGRKVYYSVSDIELLLEAAGDLIPR
ncbi:hypothetical protein HY496_03730 [Candidatus Woesearchaeota archaeon]|nr:hypothetical protein [Candidatus Woesearchaeota archaeon]